MQVHCIYQDGNRCIIYVSSIAVVAEKLFQICRTEFVRILNIYNVGMRKFFIMNVLALDLGTRIRHLE
jgi:hypothetical protein